MNRGPLGVRNVIQLALAVVFVIPALNAGNVVARISRLVAVQAAPGTVLQLSGRYVDASEEVRRHALSGTELHLFPDGTYIHAEWADILPLTIDDMGRWRVANGVVTLESGRTITWKVQLERQMFPIRRLGRHEVLLMGPKQLAYFEQHAHDAPDDPTFMLLITTLQLEERYGPTKARTVRKKLRPRPGILVFSVRQSGRLT